MNNGKRRKHIAIILLISIILPVIPANYSTVATTMAPHLIYGYAEFNGSGAADGAFVQIISSLGTVHTLVGPAGGWISGYWEVDIGDPGPNWTAGTSFTVIIVDNSSGWVSNAVSDTVETGDTDMGTLLLYPPTPLTITAYTNTTTVYAENPIAFLGNTSGGSPPYTWEWDFGDGSVANEQNPTYSYSDPGNYTVTVTVTDILLSTAMDSMNMTVIPAFNVGAYGPYFGTVNQNVSFQGKAVGGVSPYTFTWDFDDNTVGSGKYVNHSYSSPGVYDVTLTVEDDLGTIRGSTTTAIISTDNLIIELDGPSDATIDETLQFNASVSNGVEPYSYSWEFGDGLGTATIKNPTYSYSNPGIYTIQCTVSDYLNASNTETMNITVNFNSTLTISANGPYSSIVNKPIYFSGNVYTGVPPFNWYWDFGDGVESTEQNPQHNYTNPGEYTVSLAVIDSEGRVGTAQTTATITQNYAPTKPTVSGTFKGEENKRYTYTIYARDPEGHDIYFFVDWGDHEETGWIGPYSSGEQIQVSHAWNDGNYILRVKARDNYNEESDWATHEVIMPHVYSYPMFQFLNQIAERCPLLQPLIDFLQVLF